jgi:MFS family permease
MRAFGGARLAAGLHGTRAAVPLGRAHLLAFCAYLSFAVVFQVFPPFFDELERELHISRTVASLAMTTFLAPLVALAFLLGVAVDRHGHRRVGGIGCAILATGGAATIAAGSLPALLAMRALAGLGGGMVLIATLRMLATTLPPERLGAGFGVFIAGLPSGTGLAFDVFNHLGGWRSSAAASAVLAGLLTLGFVLIAPTAAPRWTQDTQGAHGRVAPAAAATLRHLALLVVVGYAAIIAFTTWAPSRLKSYAGLSPAITAAIASLLLLIDLPFAPIWGRLSDMLERRKPFVVASFLVYGTGAALVPFIAAPGGPPVGLLIGVVAMMGIGCAMFFPATLAIPPVLIPGHQLGRSYGLFLTAQAIGMAAGPLALGAIFSAGTRAGFLVIAALAGFGFLASLRLRAG